MFDSQRERQNIHVYARLRENLDAEERADFDHELAHALSGYIDPAVFAMACQIAHSVVVERQPLIW